MTDKITNQTEDVLLSVSDVADRLQLTAVTIHNWIRARKLAVEQPDGKHYYIRMSEYRKMATKLEIGDKQAPTPTRLLQSDQAWQRMLRIVEKKFTSRELTVDEYVELRTVIEKHANPAKRRAQLHLDSIKDLVNNENGFLGDETQPIPYEGDAAAVLSNLVQDQSPLQQSSEEVPIVADMSGTEEAEEGSDAGPHLTLHLPRRMLNKAWYYHKREDGQEFFLAFVNKLDRKTNLTASSMRMFRKDTGKAFGH